MKKIYFSEIRYSLVKDQIFNFLRTGRELDACFDTSACVAQYMLYDI